jgi:glycerol-3-phosphate O-acyltransferase
VLVEAAANETRRFRNRPLRVAWATLWYLVARAVGRRAGFGTAAAGFGAPVSLRAHLAEGGTVDGLGVRLMAAISEVVPVLPVPLVARALGEGAASRAELRGRVEALIGRLAAAGAVLKLPPQGLDVVLAEGLTPLIGRGLVAEDAVSGALQPALAERRLLAFYAASIPDV